jgi:ABC-type amino acid transport substrate-binding protein
MSVVAVPTNVGRWVLNILSTLLSFVILSSTALAGDTQTTPLIVGVTELPPYAIKAEDGSWQGLGVELWTRAAREMGVEFVFREYDRTKSITQALVDREIDLTCMAAVNEANETILDLSHAYHRTGLDIVVSLTSRGRQWLDYLRQVSWGNIIAVVGLFIFISLIAGIILWCFERKANPDMFGDQLSSGIGNGLWWALVTMTTVGYGDKAPKTIGGRMVAVVWMFLSVSFIAGYTAVITSSMTVSELSGRVRDARDLPHARVGALSRSETFDVLVSKGISPIPFNDLPAGLQAVADRRIDAFVDNEAQLTYLVRNIFPGRLLVLGETFEHHYVAMVLQAGSVWREPLNRAIAKIILEDQWDQLKLKYMGRSE